MVGLYSLHYGRIIDFVALYVQCLKRQTMCLGWIHLDIRTWNSHCCLCDFQYPIILKSNFANVSYGLYFFIQFQPIYSIKNFTKVGENIPIKSAFDRKKINVLKLTKELKGLELVIYEEHIWNIF